MPVKSGVERARSLPRTLMADGIPANVQVLRLHRVEAAAIARRGSGVLDGGVNGR